MTLLQVDGLTVSFGGQPVVDDVSFTVDSGEAVGIVGESGCGKTQTALAIMGLSPPGARLAGSVRFDGAELLNGDPETIRSLRATRLAMVFQDPALALNPYLTIGRQLGAILKAHRIATGPALRARVVAALDRVGLPDPDRQFSSYPHELSGGMRQRALIAAALLCEPDVLLADEPTTALDVTVQAQILDLLDEIRGTTALVLITHDLGIIAGRCRRTVVLDQGRLIEAGPTDTIFKAPRHDRTRALLAAARNFDKPPPVAGDEAVLLSTEQLSVSYDVGGGRKLTAVRETDLALGRGETLAIVGESGSGKTSIARAVLGLAAPAAGRVVFCGNTLAPLLDDRGLAIRRDLQLVFQDPAGSLSPSRTVRRILAEPLRIHEKTLDEDAIATRVAAGLDSVGLDPRLLDAYPHELSGGQAQRVAIARALLLRSALLVCDESVAALDGRARQRILALLKSAQEETGLSILFITHDLAVARSIAHRVAVMYLGRIVEAGPATAIFAHPRHPYTRALLDAVPRPDPDAPGGVATLEGEIPSALVPPPGCVFETRCRFAQDLCRESPPQLDSAGESRVACLRAAELDLREAPAG